MSGRLALSWPWLIGLLLSGLATPVPARTVHVERSLYQNILITETRDRVCMRFSVRKDQRNQSCFERDRPRWMVFTYTRMMMAGLLANPAPTEVLIIGLGGGTLPTALAELLPTSHIDVVEIDPAVVSMARRFFGFSESTRIRIVEQDARVFGRRAVGRERRYDLIVLDAFTADYIPEHLMTAEYLAETRALLAPGGVLVANTFAGSRLYDHESMTYVEVFDSFYNLRSWDSGNRIIIAGAGPLPDRKQLLANAEIWQRRLRPYGVQIRRFARDLTTTPDWDTDARVLTDQYSPANLLQGIVE